jgi:hypothetical protein
MDALPDTAKALDLLAEQLASLPIETHLAGDRAIIEHCRSYLMKALQFWNVNRGKAASIDAFTPMLSYDYHQVKKTGSRELRHLLNIYEANRGELEKIRLHIKVRSLPFKY